MITCDYLIIGSGFAGLGLKYKLQGKTILIDQNPFQYKIGESQIPNLIHSDPGIFSLIPKIVKMKSFTRKLGTVFCDSYHGKYASQFPSPVGSAVVLHLGCPSADSPNKYFLKLAPIMDKIFHN